MAKMKDTTPAIERIVAHIASRIEVGAIKPGDRLPSRSALAEQFDVVLGTVSIALRRLDKLHPLNFRPGKGVFLSDGKEGRRPFTIGLIGLYASQMAREQDDTPSRDYWSSIVRNIMLSCEKQQYALLFISATAREPLDLDRIASTGADCLVSHAISLSRETVLELRRRGQPLVLGNRGDGSLPSLGTSYVDYGVVDVFRQAVRIFCEEGRERIACVFMESSDDAWTTWRDAFRLEATECGIATPSNDYCRTAPWETTLKESRIREVFRLETEALLDLPDPPTAILFHTESYVLDGALQVIRERGLEPGKDISLLGLALPGDEANAPFGVFVENAEALGEQIVETAAKLAAAPHEVFHIDVPMTFVRK